MLIKEKISDLLEAVAQGHNGVSTADGVASRVGYKPAIKGRLAVVSRLNSAADKGYVQPMTSQGSGIRTYRLTASGLQYLDELGVDELF